MVGALKAEGEFALSLKLHLALVLKADHLSVRHIVEVRAGRLHPLIRTQLFEEISPDAILGLVARNEIGEIFLLLEQRLCRFPVSGLTRQALPVISGPDAGGQVEIPVAEGNRIGADGVIDQVKIRDVVLSRVHNAHLRLSAIGIVVLLRKIADQVIRVIGNLNVKALKLQNVVNQILGVVKIVSHTAVVELDGLHTVSPLSKAFWIL